MTDNTSRLVLENIGLTIHTIDLPTFLLRRKLREKLYGTWWRRLWWGHIAKLVAPKRYERVVNGLTAAERKAMQELVDATLAAGFMAGHGGSE